MDGKNRFHTRATYQLMKLDYLVVLALLLGLTAVHWRDIHWGWFLVAFWWIDVVGYIPGALWYYLREKGERRRVPAAFPLAYNFAHNFGVNALVLGVWYVAAGGWDWTMLAQPIHLCIDRGVFGNVYKPLTLSYEPVSHPLFEKFSAELEGAGRW